MPELIDFRNIARKYLIPVAKIRERGITSITKGATQMKITKGTESRLTESMVDAMVFNLTPSQLVKVFSYEDLTTMRGAYAKDTRIAVKFSLVQFAFKRINKALDLIDLRHRETK